MAKRSVRIENLLPYNCLRIFRQKVQGASAWCNGIVIDSSDKLLLMQMISSDIYLNGYQIIRRRDISHIEYPIPHETFVLKALALRDQQPSHPGHIDLHSMEAALRSIARLSPLVVIHQEITDPGLYWIGQIQKLDNEVLHLQNISPDAVLESGYEQHDTENITRVEFESAYAKALWQVCNT